MMNLTNKQWLAISIAVLGFLAASSGQLSDFLGPEVAKQVASGAAFAGGILGTIMTVITGQVSQVRDVEAMPGVERITVNNRANATLAGMVLNPAERKIQPEVGAEREIENIARGTV